MGDGNAQCILCGDEFGLLGASPTYCDDCRKVTRYQEYYGNRVSLFVYRAGWKDTSSSYWLWY